MKREEFVSLMSKKTREFDPEFIDYIIERVLKKTEWKDNGMPVSADIAMCLMEETGELVGAMSHRHRGRTEDNYELLEETADVILNLLCVCKLYGIKMPDLKKAIMIKCEREAGRTNPDGSPKTTES